jgi:hypothetical protein
MITYLVLSNDLFLPGAKRDSHSWLQVGDNVGVGCFVDSCRSCGNCKLGDEQYCAGGMVGTYNGEQRPELHPSSLMMMVFDDCLG